MGPKGFLAQIVTGEIPQAPIAKLLGWTFFRFDEKLLEMEVEMTARPEFINPAGFVHGGMLAAMH